MVYTTCRFHFKLSFTYETCLLRYDINKPWSIVIFVLCQQNTTYLSSVLVKRKHILKPVPIMTVIDNHVKILTENGFFQR